MHRALVLFVLLGACRSETVQAPASTQIREITAVAEAMAPSDAKAMQVSVTVRASDPAMVRVYGWAPEQADQVRAYMASNNGALGRWAIGPVASQPIMAGPQGTVELAAPTRAGWFYATAIEPLSALNGGTFDVRHVSIKFGKD